MAAAPRYKVYNPSGEYVAASKYAEDAALVAQGYGEGATVRLGHRQRDTAYTVGFGDDSADEGREKIHAAEEAAR